MGPGEVGSTPSFDQFNIETSTPKGDVAAKPVHGKSGGSKVTLKKVVLAFAFILGSALVGAGVGGLVAGPVGAIAGAVIGASVATAIILALFIRSVLKKEPEEGGKTTPGAPGTAAQKIETVKTQKKTPEQLMAGAKSLIQFIASDDALKQSLLSSEGIFRISGRKEVQGKIADEIVTKGEDANLTDLKPTPDNEVSVHDFACAIKNLFREAPLFTSEKKATEATGESTTAPPTDLYTSFVAIGQKYKDVDLNSIVASDQEKEAEIIHQLILLKDQLPTQEEKDAFKALMGLMNEVANKGEANKMTNMSLGLVIGPNLCYKKGGSLQELATDSAPINKTAGLFIKYFAQVFE